MLSSFARHPATRLLALLPVLVVAGCGNDTGAIITVPNAVVVADLRGDGLPDVVAVSAQIDETGLTQKPSLLQVILNNPSSPGTFGGGTSYPASHAPPSGLAVGDLSGTGSKDMVVANLNAGTLTVFKESSPTSGTFNSPTTITLASGSKPNDVQIADLNGDGLPDLIVAEDSGNVTYLLQNPASPGTFQPGVSLPVTNRGIAAAVGDLNGDGLADIAVSSFDVEGDGGLITVYFQNPASPGTFLPTPLVITAYGEPTQIRIADVNQDGINDIVAAAQGLGFEQDPTQPTTSPAYLESLEGAMVILQNAAAPGTFAAPVIYPATAGVLSLAIGDLNGDGLPDIAMCSLYPQGEGTIVPLMQNPAAPGTFVASTTTLLGLGQPSSIVIGDLNNDGLPDLITSDATSAVWYKNNSAAPGTFVEVGQIRN